MKSSKPELKPDDMRAWLDSIPTTDTRAAMIAFVRERTERAYAEKNPDLLPSVCEVAGHVNLSRRHTNSVLIEIAERRKVGRVVRWAIC